MHRQELFDAIFYGTVETRLDLSKMLYDRLETQLVTDSALQASLKLLQDRAEALSRHMEKMEMGKTCSSCAVDAGGGCCSLTITEETDAIQLLMNMLVGVDVKIVRNNGEECSFLGDRGCIFSFKPMFCLNYNCWKVNAAGSPDDLHQLHHLTGQLLGQQYAVETMLLRMATERFCS